MCLILTTRETVYNGIDIDEFTFQPKAEDYLMIAGRIVPEKGVREAVQIAQQTKRRLLIAGSLSKQNYWYFDEHIKPFLDDKIPFWHARPRPADPLLSKAAAVRLSKG